MPEPKKPQAKRERRRHRPVSPPAPRAGDLKKIETELRDLPPQSGLFLMFTGMIGGLCVPGLPGVGIVVLGGMVAAPKLKWLRGTDDWLKHHAPEVRGEALRFAHRFFRDLDKRFPRKPHFPKST